MIGRNDPCWCGSGRKFKKCHGAPGGPPAEAASPAGPAGMLPNPDHVAGMRRAGRFNGELMDYVRPFVQPGVSTARIDDLVREYTLAHGHTPACLGYRGYPKSCWVSGDDVVCHGIPSPLQVLREGQIVNVDLTTIVDGYYGDSSETFLLGEVSPAARRLAETTAEALVLGINMVKPGQRISVIGAAIGPFARSRGYSVVREFTGHAIGRTFHGSFAVPHWEEPDGANPVMQPGLTFTIEPMINLGDWPVSIDPRDGWTVRTRDGRLSAQFEHTVLVTSAGAEVLTLTPSQRAAGAILVFEGKSYGPLPA